MIGECCLGRAKSDPVPDSDIGAVIMLLPFPMDDLDCLQTAR